MSDFEVYFDGTETVLILEVEQQGLRGPVGPRGPIGKHSVRAALATDRAAHYMGTAPSGSLEIDPVWDVVKIGLEPVSTSHFEEVSWTDREML